MKEKNKFESYNEGITLITSSEERNNDRTTDEKFVLIHRVD